jgi:hypothetical protein
VSTESTLLVSEAPESRVDPVGSRRSVRLWPMAALLVVYWLVSFVVGAIDKPYFLSFLYNLGSSSLVVLLFFVLWWSNRTMPLADRALGFLLFVAAALLDDPWFRSRSARGDC